MKKAPGGLGVEEAMTLVEMLLVIAILAVFLALSLPGLSLLRGRSQEGRCMANLRQIGTAFASYCADNSGVLPYGYHPSFGYWSGQLKPYLPYTGPTFKVYFCPAEKVVSKTEGRSNYIANPYVLPDGQKPLMKRTPLVRIQRPSQVAILFDGGVGSTGNSDWGIWAHPEVTRYTSEADADRSLPQGPDSDGAPSTIRWRHRQSTQCLFVDGHVSAMKVGELRQKNLHVDY